MKNLIIFCILIFIYGFVFAQEKRNKKSSNYKTYDSLARVEINQLKNGALIVRLKTIKNTIAALKKNENFEQALNIELKQKEFNLSIISAFRRNFNFCPI